MNINVYSEDQSKVLIQKTKDYVENLDKCNWCSTFESKK